MYVDSLAGRRTRLRANLKGRVHAGMVSNVDDVLLPLVVLQLPGADEGLVRDRLFNRIEVFLSICKAFDCRVMLVDQIVDFSDMSVFYKRSSQR